ncbi:hypothetical protein [Flavobacterium sp. ALD4]|uniref:hypothetical protein n=1 Tax=Flavobacterium sp. ALD4 TaxID=2058314 RepID=UPI003517DD8A
MIINEGGFAIPFDVNIIYTDGTKETVLGTPAIWEANQKTATISFKGTKKMKSRTLNGGLFMDATPLNNTWSSK